MALCVSPTHSCRLALPFIHLCVPFKLRVAECVWGFFFFLLLTLVQDSVKNSSPDMSCSVIITRKEEKKRMFSLDFLFFCSAMSQQLRSCRRCQSGGVAELMRRHLRRPTPRLRTPGSSLFVLITVPPLHFLPLVVLTRVRSVAEDC